MSVIITTSLGDVTIDLYTEQCPLTSKNFLKLCKIKYFNGCLFYTIQKDFTAQTGDPTGKGTGGDSIYKFLYGDQARFFSDEIRPDLKHSRLGTVAMASAGENLNASQFYITLRDDLDYLDGKHTVFGQVEEGLEVLTRINEAYVDEKGRPYKNIRIKHTYIIDDPFDDPPQLTELIPDRSPEGKPTEEDSEDVRLEDDWVPLDEQMTAAELEETIRAREAHTHAVLLETMGDIPDAEIKPPDNVLFVCKLNPVTQDEDLDTIFSQFGNVVSAEIIRDYKTGDSLCYAFIEFETKEACERAYFKMDNTLIDDRRIHVDFSQSVSKLWSSYRRGGRKQSDQERGCFKCGELGHVAKDCEGNSNRQQSSKYMLREDNRQHGGSTQSYEMVFDGDTVGTSPRLGKRTRELERKDGPEKKRVRTSGHRRYRDRDIEHPTENGRGSLDRKDRNRKEERKTENGRDDMGRRTTTDREMHRREIDASHRREQDVGKVAGHGDRYWTSKDGKHSSTEREDDERENVKGTRTREDVSTRARDDRNHEKRRGDRGKDHHNSRDERQYEKRSRNYDDAPPRKREDRYSSVRTDRGGSHRRSHETDDRK